MLLQPLPTVNTPAVDKIRQLASDVFEVPLSEISPGSSPDTVATWDSLHHLNLVLALEQEFGIQFSPEEIEQLLSIELIDALIAEKQQASGMEAGR